MLLSVPGTPCGGDRRECVGVHEREVHLLYGNPHGGDVLFWIVIPAVFRDLCVVFYHDLCGL